MTRVLFFDTSLSSPGVAIVEVKNGKPRIIAMSHIKPNAKLEHGLRTEIVEAWATLFIADHISKGFSAVLREDFNGRTSTQNYPVFAAWSGTQRAAEKFGLKFDMWREPGKRASLGPTPSKIKLLVCGKGRGAADKDEVAAGVRRLTGYDGEFATDDQSDAAAGALAYLIHEGVISWGRL